METKEELKTKIIRLETEIKLLKERIKELEARAYVGYIPDRLTRQSTKPLKPFHEISPIVKKGHYII